VICECDETTIGTATNSADLSASEADSRSAGQEIPHRLQNPKVRYRVHKGTPLDPIPSQMNPIDTIIF